MKRNMGIKAPVQSGIEDFKGFFQDRIRTMVRNGLLDLIAREVTDLCGESHRPDDGICRRAGDVYWRYLKSRPSGIISFPTGTATAIPHPVSQSFVLLTFQQKIERPREPASLILRSGK